MESKDKVKMFKRVFLETMSQMAGRKESEIMDQYIVNVNKVWNECCIDLKYHFKQLYIKFKGMKPEEIVQKATQQKTGISEMDLANMNDTFRLALNYSQDKATSREYFLLNTVAQCCTAKRMQWFNDMRNTMITILRENGKSIEFYIQSLNNGKETNKSKNKEEKTSSTKPQGDGSENDSGTTEGLEGEKVILPGKTESKRRKVRAVRKRTSGGAI